MMHMNHLISKLQLMLRKLNIHIRSDTNLVSHLDFIPSKSRDCRKLGSQDDLHCCNSPEKTASKV